MGRLLDRARERPSEAGLFGGLVQACRYCGLLEASVAASERAIRLDPNLPTSVCYTYWMLGDYERAIKANADDLPFIVCYCLTMLGRIDEALEFFQSPGWRKRPHMASLATAMEAMLRGEREPALAMMRVVLESSFRDPEGIYFIARGFAQLGETEESLRILDRVVEGGFYCDQTMARDPYLDSVRTNPEFMRILRRAESLRRECVVEYLEHEGDRILGVSPAP
jgi:tetratricopeptide (TPR) repeat protein